MCKLRKVILCSIHQLPNNKKRIKDLILNMKNVEFHFALEGISGKGEKFLLECIRETKIFNKAKIIDSQNITWSKLYKLKKRSRNI